MVKFSSTVILVALCAVGATLGASVADPVLICEPNKMFMKDCNKCRCNPTGTVAGCTKMGCTTYDRERREIRPHTPEYRCTPGHTFMDDCNHCVCNSEGTRAICTVMDC